MRRALVSCEAFNLYTETAGEQGRGIQLFSPNLKICNLNAHHLSLSLTLNHYIEWIEILAANPDYSEYDGFDITRITGSSCKSLLSRKILKDRPLTM